jgi:adenylate cyclase
MKRCPQCDFAYVDETLNFCLEDGTPLAYAATGDVTIATRILSGETSQESPTVVLQNSPPATGILRSIAVLPFSNISADAANEYFCDGLAEELLNALAKVERLKVAARTSAFAFKNKDASVSEIARSLNVDSILEGSIQKNRDRVRITVQLVDTANGYHLWSERFDRVMDDIFDIQDEITAAVVDALKIQLLGGAAVKKVRRSTQNAEAYELYLKGRYNWNKMEGAALQRAVDYYRQALEVDAAYALAYAGLADAYVLLVNHAGAPIKETIPMATAAARKAIELDPELADGYISLGLVKTFYDWDWTGAELSLRRAIELNPSSSHARHILAIRLCLDGRFEEASEYFRGAHDLDPLSPSINEHLAFPDYYSRNYDGAIMQFEKTIAMEPGFKNVHFRLGLAYLQKGRYEEAIEKIQDAQKISFDRDAVAWIGYAYGLMGKATEARVVLAELHTFAEQMYVPSYNFAIVHLGLGEPEEAFGWLERGAKDKDYWLIFINIDPDLDPLRNDPRFDRLVQTVGIPTAEARAI